MSRLQPANPAKPPLTSLQKIDIQYSRFLNRRWFGFVVRAGVWMGVTLGLSTYFMTGRGAAFILGFTLSLFLFPVTLYPVLSARRAFITRPGPTLSRQSNAPLPLFLSTILSARHLQLLGTYLAFAVGYTVLYCQMVNYAAPAREFGFRSPTPRYPLHLNERFIFLVLGQAGLYTLMWLGDILSTSLRPVWPTKKVRLATAAQDALVEGLAGFVLDIFRGKGTFISVSAFGLLYPLSYFFFRRSIWMFLFTHSMGLLRPFIINFARSANASISWSMVFHLYYLATSSLIAMRVVTTMLSVYVTQPLEFASFTKSALSPDQYLLVALQSPEQYHRHATLMELVRVAHDPSRRRAIFSDVSRSPVLVVEVYQSLLLMLGTTYKTLATRGGYSTPVTVLPKRTAASDPHMISLKSGDVFKPVPRSKSSFGLTLQHVLDGPIKATPPRPVVNAEIMAKKVEDNALIRARAVTSQVAGRIEGNPVGATVIRETKDWLNGVNSWAGRHWVSRQVDVSLPDTDILRWTVDVLATLTVASAEEDTFGYVQQLLPATLEALVRLRSAALAFETELVSRASLMRGMEKGASAQAKTSVGQSVQVCEVGVRRIAERFGSSLNVFRFPSSIASALTEICQPPAPAES